MTCEAANAGGSRQSRQRVEWMSGLAGSWRRASRDMDVAREPQGWVYGGLPGTHPVAT